MFQGLQETIVVTQDIGRMADGFIAVGGWTLETLPDAPAEQAQAWGIADGTQRIEQALLIPPGAEDRGWLRLVRLHGAGRQPVMRSAAPIWDTGGIFDVDCYCADARAIFNRLEDRGWIGVGPAADYSMGEFKVCEALMRGPDGIVVGFLEPEGPPAIAHAPFGEGFSRAFVSAQTVRDYDASLAFYRDTLGWSVLVDLTLQDQEEPGRDIMAIPMPLAKSTPRRVAIIHPTGGNDGALEIIAFPDIAGRDLSASCRAPGRGLFAWRFPVPDAAARIAELRAAGVTVVAEPTVYEIAPYGRVVAGAILTPDGARLELFSRFSP